MNPPTDPLQLLIYGLATVFVITGLKLWDRRRDGKLQRTAEEIRQQVTTAAEHADVAAQHAGAAAAASVTAEKTTETRASGAQAETLLQVGHDTNAMLVQVLLRLGAMQEQVHRLEDLPTRVTHIEEELDQLIFPGNTRRRQDPRS